jgi:hypothetical protein
MRSRSARGALVLGVLFIGLRGASACTPLSGLSGDAAGDGGTVSEAGPDGPSSGADAGDASDETVVCPSSQRACGTDCAVLTTSPQHCGACFHDCGGGACKDGVCQPTLVEGAIANLSAFAIDGTSVYFGHDDKLSSCPLAGCTTTPTQLASMNTQPVIAPILAAGGQIFFQSAPSQVTTRPTIFGCPVAGCPAGTPPERFGPFLGPLYQLAWSGAALFATGQDVGLRWASCPGGVCGSSMSLYSTAADIGALAADSNGAYYMLPGEAGPTALELWHCAPPGPCTPSMIADGFYQAVKTIAFGGKLHVLSTGGQGYANGTITACAAPDCAGRTTPLTKLSFPSDFAVDATAYYWISADNDTIETCPLAGCVGGVRTLAVQQGQAQNLLVDNGFVYWMVGAGTPNGAIIRVAR